MIKMVELMWDQARVASLTGYKALQIVEQSEDLTKWLKLKGSLRVPNGWRVGSVNMPEAILASKTLYVRGADKTQDRSVYVVQQDVATQIQTAVEQCNAIYCAELAKAELAKAELAKKAASLDGKQVEIEGLRYRLVLVTDERK